MKTKISLTLTLFLAVGIGLYLLKPQQTLTKNAKTQETPQNNSRVEKEPDEIEELTPEEKVGQLFIGGQEEADVLKEQIELTKKYRLSGVILMGVNVSSPQKTKDSLAKLKDAEGELKQPLFISIDEEGSTITRLKDQLSEQTPQSAITTTDQAFEIAKTRGEELSALGFNLVYSPVIDAATPESFIYSRTFHAQKDEYAPLAAAMLSGFKDVGVVGVPKHFPGHPPASSDSHLGLPTSSATLEDMPSYASQFYELLKKDPPAMLMTGHILFPEIDAEHPATLSPIFIKEILRDQLGYQGVVITDDLDMDAISDTYSPEEAAVLALEAGNDIILYVTSIENQERAIQGMLEAVRSGRISEQRIDESVQRVLKLKSSL